MPFQVEKCAPTNRKTKIQAPSDNLCLLYCEKIYIIETRIVKWRVTKYEKAI